MKKSVLLGLLFFGACTFAQKTGNDKDAHGCIGSAGYLYSKIEKKCVRPFEQQFKMSDVKSGNSQKMAAVIFSDNMKKAEVLLPEGNMILRKVSRKGDYWKKGKYVLLPYGKKGYHLKKNDVVIYQ